LRKDAQTSSQDEPRESITPRRRIDPVEIPREPGSLRDFLGLPIEPGTIAARLADVEPMGMHRLDASRLADVGATSGAIAIALAACGAPASQVPDLAVATSAKKKRNPRLAQSVNIQGW
jgi:hypothetical protein